jgi:hypothetical protein
VIGHGQRQTAVKHPRTPNPELRTGIAHPELGSGNPTADFQHSKSFSQKRTRDPRSSFVFIRSIARKPTKYPKRTRETRHHPPKYTLWWGGHSCRLPTFLSAFRVSNLHRFPQPATTFGRQTSVAYAFRRPARIPLLKPCPPGPAASCREPPALFAVNAAGFPQRRGCTLS